MIKIKDWPDPPDGPPKRVIKEDIKISWDKFRTRISWVLFAVIAIPMLCLLAVATAFGVCGLILLFMPVLIAPKQEMRFGAKITVGLQKAWKWSFHRDLK